MGADVVVQGVVIATDVSANWTESFVHRLAGVVFVRPTRHTDGQEEPIKSKVIVASVEVRVIMADELPVARAHEGFHKVDG